MVNPMKDLYIGKSQIDIVEPLGKKYSGNIPLGRIATVAPIYDRSKYHFYMNCLYLPNGDEDLELEGPCIKRFLRPSKHVLYITAVPKFKNLDLYRFNNCLWSSYYEDSHRGYLFQILESNQKVELREISIKRHGSSRISSNVKNG